MEKKTRNSNIELLRIIAIISIIAHHYLQNVFLDIEFYNANQYLIQIFKIGGALGVDIFFIISGYYMYKSKFTIKKLLKLEGEVLFYAITIFVVYIVIKEKYNRITFTNCMRVFFPSLSNTYWFFSSYLVLMIFSKYINKFADCLDKSTLKKLLFILAIIDFILPTYFKVKLDNIFIDKACSLYLIGVYMRKYDIAKKENTKQYIKKAWKYFIINSIVTATLIYVAHITKWNISEDNYYFAYHTNPIILMIAIYMILASISKPINSNKLINMIASTSFGVYLIHDHFIIKSFLWGDLAKGKELYDKPYLIVNFVAIITLIFIVCSIIDLIRINTIEKLYMKIVEKVTKKLNKIENKKVLKVGLEKLQEGETKNGKENKKLKHRIT